MLQLKKTTVNLLCICYYFLKENKVTVKKADNKRRKKLSKQSKDQHELSLKGWNIFFSMPMSIIVWVHVVVIFPHCRTVMKVKMNKNLNLYFFCTCSFSQRLHGRIWMSIYYYNGNRLYVWIHPLHLDSLSLICLRLWFRFTLALLIIKIIFNKTIWLYKYHNLSRVGALKNNTEQSHGFLWIPMV